ncbi:hypothetical protein GCM10025867_31720 [Frondihabitans sucicola]|uniref:DUF1990 domain-containing protein n=1 Tax=Frondihabitans sucicola TaxID=1268041 RepID=A0ABN6Y1M3_9MICO|nr:hypothetical protein GCM10025867_31720 [Frondihabitans sucicola]
MRRATHTETQTTYGQVGATQAPDLMQYPPAGFRPVEYRTRVGHGDARFEAAWAAIMTWKVQERSGIKVTVDEIPAVDEGAYTPVTFDDEGNPSILPTTPRPTANRTSLRRVSRSSPPAPRPRSRSGPTAEPRTPPCASSTSSTSRPARASPTEPSRVTPRAAKSRG